MYLQQLAKGIAIGVAMLGVTTLYTWIAFLAFQYYFPE